jgi:hypothetical protein
MNQSNENLLKSSIKSMSQLSIAQGQLKKNKEFNTSCDISLNLLFISDLFRARFTTSKLAVSFEIVLSMYMTKFL